MPGQGLNVVVVCAGSHALVVADILHCAHRAGAAMRPIGFVDDDPSRAGGMVGSLPILGPLAALGDIEHDAVVVAMGDNALRRQITERLTQQGETLVSAIHPVSVIAMSATIGAGVVVGPGAIVQPHAHVGDGVIVNSQAVVEHESTIERFAHLSLGVMVGGQVRIGEETLCGIGAIVVSQRTVGARTTIGAGSVVVRDIPSDVTAWGTPARVVRRRGESAGA